MTLQFTLRSHYYIKPKIHSRSIRIIKGCGNDIPVGNEEISINPFKNHQILKKNKWKIPTGKKALFNKLKNQRI